MVVDLGGVIALFFVEIIFGMCFIGFYMIIEYIKCNFRAKNIFPKIPSRRVKVKNIEIPA